jgi:hypothetical protein
MKKPCSDCIEPTLVDELLSVRSRPPSARFCLRLHGAMKGERW